MDTADVQALVEDFDGNIDDLEEALAPLLQTALSASTSKLPLLDKAKLYVLATYAIESILFSALRLNGVDAKSHPVFQELTRVKEYFEKIKKAENAGVKRNTTVDKDAAGRFIKHGLAGNEKYDRERSHRAQGERAGAKRKLEDLQGIGTHTRFDGPAKRMKDTEMVHVERQDIEPQESQSVSREQRRLDKADAKRKRRQEVRVAGGEPDAVLTADAQSDVEANTVDDVHATAPIVHPSPITTNSHIDTPHAPLLGLPPAVEDKKSKRKKRKSKGQLWQDLEDQRAAEMK